MKKVAVLHPDLGIGGAERLIVDICLALKKGGYEVVLLTGFHDSSRCFKETKDGTIPVIKVGHWIPRTLFGKFHALMAYIKMIYIAIYLMMNISYDAVICDQVSACIPILKLNFFKAQKIIFYCHFPDLLLVQKHSVIRSLYRWPLNKFEEWSTSLADSILVNSEFTSQTVKKTFTSIRKRKLEVLYPCVDIKSLTKQSQASDIYDSEDVMKALEKTKNAQVFLSINRYEKKKNLNLAIDAFSMFVETYKKLNESLVVKAHLILAGGFDNRLRENVDCYKELTELVISKKMENFVTFLKNPSDKDKTSLLRRCKVVVYTPKNEHFGIVPLEAMAMSKPIIGVGSGGVLETVVNNKTGLLYNSSVKEFSSGMLELYSNEKLGDQLGKNGYLRVNEHFSFETFSRKLCACISIRS